MRGGQRIVAEITILCGNSRDFIFTFYELFSILIMEIYCRIMKYKKCKNFMVEIKK